MGSVKEYIVVDLTMMVVLIGIVMLLSINTGKPMEAIVWVSLMIFLVGLGYLMGYKIERRGEER